MCIDVAALSSGSFTLLPDAIKKLVGIGSLRDLVLSGFFVIEGKLKLITTDIPQAVAEMYACAKVLGYEVVQIINEHRLLIPYRQKIFRGALTNGLEWIFIILYLNDDGDGATYKFSEVIEVRLESRTLGPTTVNEPGPDIIAGMLSCWVS